ncbi:MAG: hypothetical protein A2096_12975 [Spirochaetes bacterium GWF1_41_5]|nr:MAG: hypothetical protein A2096_12975 [Spirochaetes bacterium GWF1_41_5]HBE02225.1 hypothetical protein [Spirochaetia bacterium]
MEANYLTSKNGQKIFSVYHEPKIKSRAGEGIIMCYPLGQEYIRAYRTCIKLAEALCARGFHVLRFDYSGTGDSSGLFEEASVKDWLADIKCAAEEFSASLGLEEINLCGVRFGASLAALFMEKYQLALNRLLLLYPVCRGAEHIAEIRKEWKTGLAGSFAAGKTRSRFSEISGFTYTDALLEEIKKTDLFRLNFNNIKKIILLENENNPRVQNLYTYIAGFHKNCVRLRGCPHAFPGPGADEEKKNIVPELDIRQIADAV